MKHFKNVLMLATEHPNPASSGAKLRNLNLIRLLAEKMPVELLTQTQGQDIAGLFQSKTILRRKEALPKRLIYPFRPYYMNGFSSEFAEEIRARYHPDTLVWVAGLSMAQYIPLAKKLGYTVVLDEHNFESDILLNSALDRASHWPWIPAALQSYWYEISLASQCNAIVATSKVDADKLERFTKRTIHIVPNLVSFDDYPKTKERLESKRTILFAGTLSYGPNIEALQWFVSEIIPRVKPSPLFKQLKLVAAGKSPPSDLKKLLERNGFEVIANPENMMPYFEQANVVIAPILTGGGTRLKILEALACKRAVITTTKGAEGLELTQDEISIEDDPTSFVSTLLWLISDDELRQKMAAHGHDVALSKYDWRAGRRSFDAVLESMERR